MDFASLSALLDDTVGHLREGRLQEAAALLRETQDPQHFSMKSILHEPKKDKSKPPPLPKDRIRFTSVLKKQEMKLGVAGRNWAAPEPETPEPKKPQPQDSRPELIRSKAAQKLADKFKP